MTSLVLSNSLDSLFKVDALASTDNSPEDRVARKIVIEQEKQNYEQCWYGNLRLEAQQIGIKLNRETIQNMKKSAWKKEVKAKIKDAFYIWIRKL